MQVVIAGAYYKELFLRGRPQLRMIMTFQKIKVTGHNQPTDVQSKPNFCAYYGPPPNDPPDVEIASSSHSDVTISTHHPDTPPL